MWVTLYTDASWHPGRRQGGWAVWAKSELGRVVRSGACPEYVKTAVHAEMAGVFAGIWLVLRAWGDRVDGIQVRSDNQQAMEAIRAGAPLFRDPVMRKLQEKVRELTVGRVFLRPRWVKGHRNPKGDVTAWLNAHCDREARLARKGLGSAQRDSPVAAEPVTAAPPKQAQPAAPAGAGKDSGSAAQQNARGLKTKRKRRHRHGRARKQADAG